MPRSKYGAKKVTLDGHTFDSKAEAHFYQYTKLRLKAGDIQAYELQPRYLLQEAFKHQGKSIQKMEYVADFLITHNDGSQEVVDVKGVETEAFKIKKKLFYKRYPDLKLSLMTYKHELGGWIELDELKKLERKAKTKRQKKGAV
ncbi:hypothetical protein CHH91_04495 [Virgibacillus sp. 7505]|uniref:DUF1064 domain-containing protein n=1 Tax=Virgibacillus sp. 7505 TaxID=2022548 RepID=UPI000BA69E11|nr:DUF1064 domain-containing protein [Virgibacillus sp. 7505]PAE17271.1 hypothetical protein CHH91_04495 [Virgibacillus sp. 7505]